MALGKVDLATARLYSSLVEDAKLRERIYDMFEAEFHRTVRALLAVTRQNELLEPTRCWPAPSSCATRMSIPCT